MSSINKQLALGLLAAFLSYATVFLYARAGPLYSLYANAPSRLQHINRLKNSDIKFQDLIRNCEDAILDTDKGIALLSCDPGRDTWNTVMGTFIDSTSPPETGIYLWNYADKSSTSKPEKLKLLDFTSHASTFHPLGIDYHADSNTLFVVNHTPSNSSIEKFKLFLREKSATHIGTIKHAFLNAPNSVAAISADQLFVTNDHFFLAKDHLLQSQLETYLALPGGSVVFVDTKTGGLEPKVHQLDSVPFANGVVLVNETALAVASSSMNSIYIYNINWQPSANGGSSSSEPEEAAGPKLTQSKKISLPFHPDNLSIDKNNKLLIAGHPHGPTLAEVSKNAARCNGVKGEDGDGEDCVRGLSYVADWTEEDGLRTLYVGDGFGTSSTAVRDVRRRFGFMCGLYERGVLSWGD